MQELINKLFKLKEEQLIKVNEYIEELLNPKKTKKRSINANSYCWVLLQELADVLNTDKETLYKKYIREKGIFRTITIDNNAVNTFIYIWTKQGLGWVCDILNKGNTTTDLMAYYGSSSYNTKQMAKFIDYIVEDAKEQGIETLTPEELESLKGSWKCENN